jgi:hypothetical protein
VRHLDVRLVVVVVVEAVAVDCAVERSRGVHSPFRSQNCEGYADGFLAQNEGLNVAEEEEEIQRKWFGDGYCTDSIRRQNNNRPRAITMKRYKTKAHCEVLRPPSHSRIPSIDAGIIRAYLKRAIARSAEPSRRREILSQKRLSVPGALSPTH